jgi:hypothetical protein
MTVTGRLQSQPESDEVRPGEARDPGTRCPTDFGRRLLTFGEDKQSLIVSLQPGYGTPTAAAIRRALHPSMIRKPPRAASEV